jgi:hypothetical protein
MNFTTEELKIIYRAVQKYQMHSVLFDSKLYSDCQTLLDRIFPLNEQTRDS